MGKHNSHCLGVFVGSPKTYAAVRVLAGICGEAKRRLEGKADFQQLNGTAVAILYAKSYENWKLKQRSVKNKVRPLFYDQNEVTAQNNIAWLNFFLTENSR